MRNLCSNGTRSNPPGFSRLGAAIVIAVLLAVLVGVPACGRQTSASPFQGAQLATVTRGNIESTLSMAGYIAMPKQQRLTFRGPGDIQEIKVKMGDTVKQGDILASLDPVLLDTAVLSAQNALATAQRTLDILLNPTDVNKSIAQGQEAAAEAQLSAAVSAYAYNVNNLSAWAAVQLAQANLAKAQDTLNKINNPDPADVDALRRQVGIAQSALDTARMQRGEATITAPFDGIVSAVYVKEGDRVASTVVAPAILLASSSVFEFDATVDEIDVTRVKAGQPILISIDALPGLSFQGTVTAVSPVGTSQAGVYMFSVTASVQSAISRAKPGNVPPSTSGTASDPQPAALATLLKEGLTGYGTVVLERRIGVLLVPARAMQMQNGKASVQVVTGDTVQRREVTVGITSGQQTEIISGLKEGDQILIPWTQVWPMTTP